MTPFVAPELLPLIFAGLMGFSILLYVILDGFDLGTGLLFPFAPEEERDQMIAAIGPFWDANETWLVLAIGLLLVAFPIAHGVILTALYLPVAVMLIGLILRGVAFDFRSKAPLPKKPLWDGAFWLGSFLSTFSQGFMLGLYILGLEWTGLNVIFSLLCALCLTWAFAFIGACWQILKSQGSLQHRAVVWARYSFWGMAAGLAAVSLATPLASPRIFQRWFSMPELLLLSPLPILSLLVLGVIWHRLQHLPAAGDRLAWLPFAGACTLMILGFAGLAYSFYPYILPDRLTIASAAASPESLSLILLGTIFVMPAIIGYTVLSYLVFRGKAVALSYD